VRFGCQSLQPAGWLIGASSVGWHRNFLAPTGRLEVTLSDLDDTLIDPDRAFHQCESVLGPAAHSIARVRHRRGLPSAKSNPTAASNAGMPMRMTFDVPAPANDAPQIVFYVTPGSVDSTCSVLPRRWAERALGHPRRCWRKFRLLSGLDCHRDGPPLPEPFGDGGQLSLYIKYS
jgi:hypothetical protein